MLHIVIRLCLLALAGLVTACAIDKLPGQPNDGELLAGLQHERPQELGDEEAMTGQRAVVSTIAVNRSGNLIDEITRDFTWGQRYGYKKRVQYELSQMTDQPYLNDIFTLAPYYLPYIVGEIKKRGMPIELALLPAIESRFRPFAYSYAHAAGMWQIIPGTGERLGLETNWWHDERRDIIASTNAALDYLQSLANRLNGDWLQAVASYNAGIGKVKRARKSNRSRGKPIDYWSTKLPRQSMRYVPRLIALSIIIANPDRYGVTIPYVDHQPAFTLLHTRGQLDLHSLAKNINVPLDTILALNPSYNQRFSNPLNQHNLLVPPAAATAASNYLLLNEHTDSYWITHRVESGQTLSQLAFSFHTSVARLRQVNKLQKDGSLRNGRYLLVPVDKQGFKRYAAFQSAAPPGRGKVKSNQRITHRLTRGDSLWKLSRQYRVSINDLMHWNNITASTLLYAGKKIIINRVKYKPATSVELNPEFDHKVVRKVLYPVRRGDSLSVIAHKFSVTSRDILFWNKDVAARGLRRGNTLQLYVDITKTY